MAGSKEGLNGSVSKQRNKVSSAKNEAVSSWEYGGSVDNETNLKIPDDYSVENAKDWVDNGSRL